mmetsp:Transcript_10735/g.25612  ORF Transcript_10735/g.25612 Transcript_10735/m.25612 type:complete len:464 (-) Transcript_10735:73-1464(-)
MVEVQVAPCHPRSVLFEACRTDLSELEPRVLGVLKSFVAQQSSRLALAEEQHAHEAQVLREQQAVARTDREEVASVLHRIVLECSAHDMVSEPQLCDDTRLVHRVSAYCHAIVEAYETKARLMEQQFQQKEKEIQEKHDALERSWDSEKQELQKQLEHTESAGNAAESAAKSARNLLAKDLERQTEKVAELTAEISRLQEEGQCLRDSVESLNAELHRKNYELEAAAEAGVQEKSEMQSIIDRVEGELKMASATESQLRSEVDKRQEAVDRMRQEMIEQEQELVEKVNRVQQYMKERSAGAMTAERRQQDAELMAERWQEDLRRVTADRDRLAKVLAEQENLCQQLRGEVRQVKEAAAEETSALHEKLSLREKEWREANVELLGKREGEWSQKVTLEKGKDKDRTALILRRKEKDLAVKEQQLSAARARIAELEQSSLVGGRAAAAGDCVLPPLLATPRARGS